MCCAMRTNIVGTPARQETRWRSISSTAAAASNAGVMTVLAPASPACRKSKAKPKLLYVGRRVRKRSESR